MIFIFQTFFIGLINSLYTPPFTLMVWSEGKKSKFSSVHLSRIIIMSYMWVNYDSTTQKFHIRIFVASISGIKLSNLPVLLVLKSPPFVLQWTCLVFLFQSFCSFLPIILENPTQSFNIVLSYFMLPFSYKFFIIQRK